MLTVTSEDVFWTIRDVKFDIITVSYTMRLLFLMFVTTVCVLFLLKLRWLFWSEIGSGFGKRRDTAPPRIPRGTLRTNVKGRVDGWTGGRVDGWTGVLCLVPVRRFPQFLLVNYNRKKQGWFYSPKYIHFSPIFLAWENSRHLATLPLVSSQMTSEKRAQKFHTDDASLPKSGWCFWLVVSRGKFDSTNQKHHSGLGSDVSSVWNICARFSDVVWRGNKW